MNPVARMARRIGRYFWSSNLSAEAAMVEAAQAAQAKSLEATDTARARLAAELKKLEASLVLSAQPSSTSPKKVQR